MKQVTFIFATGKSWMDFLVTTVTKSVWSHAALRFDSDDMLVEALANRGVILQPGDKYEGWIPSLMIRRQVKEQAYAEMLLRSKAWVAARIPYGYRTCAAIGVKEIFGQKAGCLALDWFAGEFTETQVCTELLVNLWRINSPDFMKGRESRLINPDELYAELTAEISLRRN